MLNRTEAGNLISPFILVDCHLTKKKQENWICTAQRRTERNICLQVKNENYYRKDSARIKTLSQVSIVS